MDRCLGQVRNDRRVSTVCKTQRFMVLTWRRGGKRGAAVALTVYLLCSTCMHVYSMCSVFMHMFVCV